MEKKGFWFALKSNVYVEFKRKEFYFTTQNADLYLLQC